MDSHTTPAPRRHLHFFQLLVGLMLMLPATAHSGTGTFDQGKFNFCVSVRFPADVNQINTITKAFQDGSQVLADATDGQHRFSTIRIVNNSGASQSADYWVNSGNGRAYATEGKYGVRGEHVNLYFADNFTTDANGDAYTVAHEHAHHAYGVLDEYSGPAGNAECAPPPDTATTNFSIMDNYFTRGGNSGGGTTYTLNEFCVSSNHDPDADTFQSSVHAESAWETIAAHPKRSATAPAGLPVDAPPAAHTVDVIEALGGLRVMLLIDRSGSMASEQRLDFAKLGAKEFINVTRPGDSLGVASFAEDVSVNFPLADATAGNKTAAETAVMGLVANGATNIGGGLLAALTQITQDPANRSCNEIIVLLSDGDNTAGTPPAGAIPQLKAAGVTVFTVGVGTSLSAAGEAALQQVANETGGLFFRVASAAELTSLFLRLGMEATGSGLLTRAPLALGAGETRETPVTVEAGTTSAVFSLVFATAASDVAFSLRSPSGAVIDASSPAVVSSRSTSNSRSLEIANPEAGEWRVIVAAGLAPLTFGEVLAFGKHDGVTLNVSLEKDMLVFPEQFVVKASLLFEGETVTGATVGGTVRRPDGSEVAITLFDDGSTSHADAMANDGVYSAIFGNYRGDGAYSFALTGTADATAATFAGEDLFLAPPSSNNVPPFQRAGSATGIATGVPVGCPTGPDLDGDNICDSIDPEDGPLALGRVRVRRTAAHPGEIIVRGDLGLGQIFDVTGGVFAVVMDGGTARVESQWAAQDCKSFKNGRVRCVTPDGRRQLHVQRRFGRLAFEIRANGLNLAGPLSPDVSVILTNAPGVLIQGIDRVGTIGGCRVTTNALQCN